jgi:plastocyanin
MNMQFKPAALKVHKGDTIVFINKDMLTHDVTETSAQLWKSPALVGGKSWHMVASQSGGYYCSFHPVMKGQITVE